MQDLQRLSPSGWVCARGRLLRVSKPIPESKFHVETPPIRQIPFVRPILEFTKLQASSGILLITVALIAMAWANSPLSEQYFYLWKRPLVVGFDTYVFSMSFHDVISDGLMAIFFLLVGLEIKREFVMGELSTVRRAALPLMAAAGGMVVPALIYLIFNKGLPTEGGWGIAVATDIAFTLGVITLLGNRVPLALKVFLTAFAIADDIGAVIIIALVYSNDLNLNALAAMGAICLLLALLNIGGVRSLVPYLVLGVFLWQATYFSGIHATVSGVLLAFFIPMNFRMRTKQFLGLVRRQLNRIERENPTTRRLPSADTTCSARLNVPQRVPACPSFGWSTPFTRGSRTPSCRCSRWRTQASLCQGWGLRPLPTQYFLGGLSAWRQARGSES
ncbi:MAG: Na+/H+ antiporter NhaA, partial [Armatimonadota bacterium]